MTCLLTQSRTEVINVFSQVYSFGCNDEGALGRNTSEEGSEATPGKVDVPGRVIMLCAGDSHTAALLDDGQVYVWGNFRVRHCWQFDSALQASSS